MVLSTAQWINGGFIFHYTLNLTRNVLEIPLASAEKKGKRVGETIIGGNERGGAQSATPGLA
jgi:hypothetical protein